MWKNNNFHIIDWNFTRAHRGSNGFKVFISLVKVSLKYIILIFSHEELVNLVKKKNLLNILLKRKYMDGNLEGFTCKFSLKWNSIKNASDIVKILPTTS